MSKDALARWQPEAEALPPKDYKPKLPIFVLIGEAHDLAMQTRRLWKSRRDRKQNIIERGLDLAGEAKLPEGTDRDLLSLAEALQLAQSRYVLTTAPATTARHLAEAELLVAELSAVLEFLFDDDVQDEKDEQLANVHAEHDADPTTPDALASELDDYAALATPHRKELHELGGFDVADIDHAIALAKVLRELPVDATATVERAASKSALDLRNRIAFLLQQRSNKVRSAARFVFRDQPDTARLFTSTYERRKRTAARRAKAKKPADGGQPGGPPTT